MQVATHPGILSVFFYWEKSKKCRNWRKPNLVGMVSGIGHKRPWKKLWQFQGCWKTMCSQTNLLTLLKQSLLNMDFLWTSMKWPKLLHADGHAHARHSCHAWAVFDTVCKLSHVRPFIAHFWGISRNNMLSNWGFWPTKTPYIEHNVFFDEMIPTFASRWACPS